MVFSCQASGSGRPRRNGPTDSGRHRAHALSVGGGRRSKPAVAGAVEVARIGESEVVGDFGDGALAVGEHVVGEALAETVEKFRKRDALALETPLQRARGEMHRVGHLLDPGLTVGKQLRHHLFGARSKGRLPHAVEVFDRKFLRHLAQNGVGARIGFDCVGVGEGDVRALGRRVDRDAEMPVKPLSIRFGKMRQTHAYGRGRHLVVRKGIGLTQNEGEHRKRRASAGLRPLERAKPQSRSLVVVRETHVHRGGNDLGVARHQIEHLRERARRHDGESETVQRRHLHFLAAAHADQGVVRFTQELFPETAHLRGGIARPGHAQKRTVEPRPFEERFRLDAVAPRRLANGPHPGRQNAVAHGELPQLGVVCQR